MSHTDETLCEFSRVLATIPEVQEAYLVSGDYDYYIPIAVRDTRDYERLLRENSTRSRASGTANRASCCACCRRRATVPLQKLASVTSALFRAPPAAGSVSPLLDPRDAIRRDR